MTKAELRVQQERLKQLERYLPTLQLKKAMLQSEVIAAAFELDTLQREFRRKMDEAKQFDALLRLTGSEELLPGLKIAQTRVNFTNIAGLDVPHLAGVAFQPPTYSLYGTPLWFDSATTTLRALIKADVKVRVQKDKKARLEKELRDVSIRVNLFEKIMIPRTKANVKKIKVFLGDQQLAAVAQAKVAKAKKSHT